MPGDAYVMRRWWLTGKLKEALNVLEDTEGGFIFEDREGEVGFHLANYRGAQTVARTFVSTTPGTDELRIVGQPRTQLAVKDVHNEVRRVKSGSSTRRPVRHSLPAWTRSRSLWAGTVALVVAYPVEDGAITELDSLVAGTDWTANTEPDGTGNNRTSQVAIQIELMDFNEIHITAVYANITGQTQADTVYIRGLTIKGTVLTESTPLTVSIEDTVSKQRYRPKTRDLRGTWLRSVSDMSTSADDALRCIGGTRTAGPLGLVHPRLERVSSAGLVRQNSRLAAQRRLRRVYRGHRRVSYRWTASTPSARWTCRW